MAITIRATKAGRLGKPAVQIEFEQGTSLDDILAAQKRVFADKRLAKAIGFRFHEACYSGLDLDIQQKYEKFFEG